MGDDAERGQSHVHEFAGSTFIAEENEFPHNHRFAGTTSEVIPWEDSHAHGILDNTDIYEDHLHEVAVQTSPAIPVGPCKHVHFVYGNTSADDRHCHKFVFATQIEDPLEWDDREKKPPARKCPLSERHFLLFRHPMAAVKPAKHVCQRNTSIYIFIG